LFALNLLLILLL